MYRVVRARFWAAVMLNIVSTALVVSGPILLREIVVFVTESQGTDENMPDGNRGLFLVLILAMILFGDALAKVTLLVRVRLGSGLGLCSLAWSGSTSIILGSNHSPHS